MLVGAIVASDDGVVSGVPDARVALADGVEGGVIGLDASVAMEIDFVVASVSDFVAIRASIVAPIV